MSDNVKKYEDQTDNNKRKRKEDRDCCLSDACDECGCCGGDCCCRCELNLCSCMECDCCSCM